MQYLNKMALAGLLGVAGLALSGCPVDPPLPPAGTYDEGFDDGFAEDDEYWQGFDDSYDTVDGGEIYFTGDTIPYYEDPPYDAGYWDGVYYAYHDGYFVAYDYAFTIGFSEGYDLAFQADYDEFLEVDEHVEWLDGGFSDGYNDGFSEGRVFGAFDWLDDRPFDWLDAMLDYREGTDLTVAGVSTGAEGPVTLYEWGQNPFDLIEGKLAAGPRVPYREGIRGGTDKQQAQEEISYRPLIADVREELNQRPETTARGGAATLRLSSTWLQRVEEYRAAQEAGTKATPRK